MLGLGNQGQFGGRSVPNRRSSRLSFGLVEIAIVGIDRRLDFFIGSAVAHHSCSRALSSTIVPSNDRKAGLAFSKDRTLQARIEVRRTGGAPPTGHDTNSAKSCAFGRQRQCLLVVTLTLAGSNAARSGGMPSGWPDPRRAHRFRDAEKEHNVRP